MTLWKWSTTAGDNDDADTTINYREGQGPSTLNNSARAMMAVIKKWWLDLSGNVVTGGTATAYTATSNQVITALDSTTDGFRIRLRMSATSGSAPTLAVDGLTAKQIRSVYGTNITTGALLENGVYDFVYDSTDDAWIVGSRFGDTLTSGSYPDLVAIEALAGTTGVARKTAANTWALDSGIYFATFTKDGKGTALVSGIQGDIPIPVASTITGVYLYADASGSVVVDLWKDSHANFPPTVADTITASAKPTLSSATKYEDVTLTGWTTSVAAGDIIRVNFDSVSTITRLAVVVRLARFI